MKALIVDGEEIYRISMKEVITAAANFDEVIEAGSEHDFLSMTASHDLFDLVVLQPATLHDDGGNCLKLVNRLYPNAKVISIGKDTHYTSNQSNFRYTTMPRTASVQEMVKAIRSSLKLPLDSYNSPCASSNMGRPKVSNLLNTEFNRFKSHVTNEHSENVKTVDLKRLSYRQRQILAMAADGLPNKEIAARLNIAEGTVKAHMHSIFKVLGVSNRTQAVIRYGASGGNNSLPQDKSPAWQQMTVA
ncbi:response regulator transcription factor [Kordiimonas sp. SCSIO 12610]|uniref:helix-turn-helix transcriptional regulator n=1 Tax=Kordiimonas sp. SCSIO 12610 TaxID=2829597 RepID=UPI00210D89F0|nr:response regulator transcription factor [Kordiimonas sp. SCSIO 12610]UTW55788.1 response regulator transcription factor [Kordiimonas sp. SCSIO 12610]